MTSQSKAAIDREINRLLNAVPRFGSVGITFWIHDGHVSRMQSTQSISVHGESFTSESGKSSQCTVASDSNQGTPTLFSLLEDTRNTKSVLNPSPELLSSKATRVHYFVRRQDPSATLAGVLEIQGETERKDSHHDKC